MVDDEKDKGKGEEVETKTPPTAPVIDENEPTFRMIDEANAAAERLEKVNAAMEQNLARQERLAAENALGGSAEAGVKAKEETPEEYAAKVLANDV